MGRPGRPDPPTHHPRKEELADWGALDACNESSVTVARGVQHKYVDMAVLLCNEICGGFCRYCFRKRLFLRGNDEVSLDVSPGLDYIARHPENSNVLLTGGDPLLLGTRRLERILAALRDIPHVRIIRLGTKMPAFDPGRIVTDDDLHRLFRTYSRPGKRIYLMAHFDHPRELTRLAVQCIDTCLQNGLICVNQCPLIKGVNDDADVLSRLYNKLSFIGCPPYYLFQGRPTAGNLPYAVPLVRGWHLFQRAIARGSGLARRARFVMSHETGKIEIMAVDDRFIFTRYHQAKNPKDLARLMIFHRDDEAFWLDELTPVDEPSVLPG